jgi:hypothetical protein
MLNEFTNFLSGNQKLVRWWVFSCCTLTLLSGILLTGGAEFINKNDFTGISWGIIFIFVSGTIFYGYRLARDENLGQGVTEYLCDLCTGLGLVGTIIGLMVMIGGAFEGIDTSDPNSIKSALVAMSSGIGAALTTTLMGLLAALLLGMQKRLVETSWN